MSMRSATVSAIGIDVGTSSISIRMGSWTRGFVDSR